MLATYRPELRRVACPKLPADTGVHPTTFRFARPPLLPDELPRAAGTESTLARFHEQLELGTLNADQAHALVCAFRAQDTQAIANQGTVERHVRSLHRRFALLVEQYLPGATKQPCP
jgi:hypothetical protein